MNLKDLVIDQDAMDRFLDEMVKRNDIQVEKVETMYLKIKDMESLKSYFEELHKLEKELPLGEELDEYWTIVELASTYGKDIIIYLQEGKEDSKWYTVRYIDSKEKNELDQILRYDLLSIL